MTAPQTGASSVAPTVFFEQRLDAAAGRRLFLATLVFSVPITLAALVVSVDAILRSPFSWLQLGAAGLLGVFAVLAANASLSAWRAVGARVWLIEEGLLLEQPERLLSLTSSTPERGWKKGAGPVLKLKTESGAPPLLFVPGLLLLVGNNLTIQSLVLGEHLERLETALKQRAARLSAET